MNSDAVPDEPSTDTRARILAAAAELIAKGGIEAATTRAVALAASVQAPTIYRLFGDKQRLLEAVAEIALAEYVSSKTTRRPDADPVRDLYLAWDDHIAFSVANPAIFALMSRAEAEVPSKAAAAGLQVLRQRVRRVAQAGRLAMNEEPAVDLINALGTGTVLGLLGKCLSGREGFAEAAREAVMTAILVEPMEGLVHAGPASLASGLRARLEEIDVLSPGERQLLDEILQRIAGSR